MFSWVLSVNDGSRTNAPSPLSHIPPRSATSKHMLARSVLHSKGSEVVPAPIQRTDHAIGPTCVTFVINNATGNFVHVHDCFHTRPQSLYPLDCPSVLLSAKF